MNKLTFLFTNAGIQYFSIEHENGRYSTLALKREPETSKLLSIVFKGKTTKGRLGTQHLRTLDELAKRFKKKVIEFKYESHDFEPDFQAKRQLSAIKLGIILPSIAMIPGYLDNLTEWAKVRVKRSLCTRDIDKTIEVLVELYTKTPRELKCEESYLRLINASATLNQWISNRKKYQLRTKEMHGALKCINRHIEVLYAA